MTATVSQTLKDLKDLKSLGRGLILWPCAKAMLPMFKRGVELKGKLRPCSVRPVAHLNTRGLSAAGSIVPGRELSIMV